MGTAQGLVLFKDYLRTPVRGKTSGPPISIKADDLDKNFRRVSVMDTNKETPLFRQTEGGTLPTTMEFDVCIDGVLMKLRMVGTIVD